MQDYQNGEKDKILQHIDDEDLRDFIKNYN